MISMVSQKTRGKSWRRTRDAHHMTTRHYHRQPWVFISEARRSFSLGSLSPRIALLVRLVSFHHNPSIVSVPWHSEEMRRDLSCDARSRKTTKEGIRPKILQFCDFFSMNCITSSSLVCYICSWEEDSDAKTSFLNWSQGSLMVQRLAVLHSSP